MLHWHDVVQTLRDLTKPDLHRDTYKDALSVSLARLPHTIAAVLAQPHLDEVCNDVHISAAAERAAVDRILRDAARVFVGR